jgi:2-haloacid dehalogenase
MPVRPRVVLFDVNETIMSLEPLALRFTEVGLPADLLPRWFDRVLRDGMALTLAGDYDSFLRVGGNALRTLSRGALDDAAVAHILAGFGELPAHQDVEPAMRLLTEHGVRLACLTNGAARTTTDFLGRSGLTGLVEQVISVADVGSWKPRGSVYRYGLDQVGCTAAETAMVAAHAWDCHGASRAGLTSAWVSRLEGHFGEIFTPATVTGVTLVEVAAGLLALPAA